MSGFIQHIKKRITFIAGASAVVLVAASIIFIVIRLNRSVSSEKHQQISANLVDVETSELRAPAADGLTIYLDASDTRAVASFDETIYLATSGGLIELDDAGNVQRRYTTLDGLPENDLTALSVFRDRLFIGTAAAGLVAFDGASFTGYRFTRPKASRVSVLVTTDTELLIGTMDGGVFEYDGQKFSRRFNSAVGALFNRITSLLPFESRLYIGTRDSGLYIWREAHIEHLTTNEGLPSPHVTALAALPPGLSDKGSVAVATDFGVVALDDANQMKQISNRPNITSLAVSGGHLWAGLFDGGILNLSATRLDEPIAAAQDRLSPPDVAGVPKSAPATVRVNEGKLWVLTGEGVFARDEETNRPLFEAVAASLVGDRLLTAGHITTVAFDSTGRLWVGYFDRGLDLIAPETSERLSHLEDDRLREINHLALDSDADRMLVATSRGLILVSPSLRPAAITREQGGLINDSIAHVSFVDIDPSSMTPVGIGPAVHRTVGRAVLLATAGGLTQLMGGRSRSVSAFHGLPSNHLYTSASVGARLFVGSLAGLAELEGLRVLRTHKTSNSGLSHDWVTALAQVDGTLYVGTNGGGVDALLPTGEWINSSSELGKFEVNQNAMHYDGERLYVGTSDRGVLVYNTRDRRWNGITSGLASQSVTAITSDDRFVYLGTLNGLVRIEKRVVD